MTKRTKCHTKLVSFAQYTNMKAENWLLSANQRTDRNSTRILGRAAWYKMNITLMPMPTKMPISNGSIRQAKNVAKPGSKSDSGKYNIEMSISQNGNSIFGLILHWILDRPHTHTLTFATPHWLDDFHFDHENDSGDDDGSECGLRDVEE